METEVLRIIEGGLANDKRKIISYSNKLAERLIKEGNEALAKCIVQKINTCIPQGQTIADAVRTLPVDTDSKLNIVEIFPPDCKRQKIVLDSKIEKQVYDFIKMIQHRSELEIAGLDIKKTMLLYGQPGCGKTSIAHFISEQTGLPLIVARLDGIVSSLLGNTAKNLRKIFEYTKSLPCILFLDEFDAIAKARDDIHELGELKRVINSLIQNIDNLGSDNILIAATNHPEMLDKAVWRRFLQIIEIGLPSDNILNEMIDIFSSPFITEFSSDSTKRNLILQSFKGLSPSLIKNIFDKVKIKIVISGEKIIKSEELLKNVFETTRKDKSEKAYVLYLYKHGVSQTSISQYSGISLRKVKSYLSSNKK